MEIMKNERILVTGHNGFLCSHLMGALKDNWFTEYGGNVCDKRMYAGVDVVMHFASPSQDIEFVDKIGTASTIIDGTLNLLDIAMENRAKFIFASTMGIYHARPGLGAVYESCKLAMDSYIQSVYNDYVILRIPRVYGKDRTKGLMRKLREGTVPKKDMSKEIDFITVDEFVEQTLPVLGREGYVHEYDVLHRETISQIKQRFI